MRYQFSVLFARHLGYGNNKTFYSAVERLFMDYNFNYVTIAYPTLECVKETKTISEEQKILNSYSRYTSKKDNNLYTDKGILVNNNLTYPIALLSADELVMAGACGGDGTTDNKSFYLYDAQKNKNSNSHWWTMTPAAAEDYIFNFINIDGGNLLGESVDSSLGIRPVINIKSDILVNGGDGTIDGPYTIKLG